MLLGNVLPDVLVQGHGGRVDAVMSAEDAGNFALRRHIFCKKNFQEHLSCGACCPYALADLGLTGPHHVQIIV